MKHTHYRYVAKDESYHTRWRLIPAEGTDRPSKGAQAKLGYGYSLQLKTPKKKKRKVA